MVFEAEAAEDDIVAVFVTLEFLKQILARASRHRKELPSAQQLVQSEPTVGGIADTLLNLIQYHQAWAPAIGFILAFGESLAFVSLFLPATVILLGVGGLVGAADIAFWPIWWAAAFGAALGDWFSYWLGLHYSYAIARIWPLSRHPELLPRGEAFFRKWGTLGVFIGRFFGPLRSIMPLVAGICGMPPLPFQLANLASAAVWAAGVLTPGLLPSNGSCDATALLSSQPRHQPL